MEVHFPLPSLPQRLSKGYVLLMESVSSTRAIKVRVGLERKDSESELFPHPLSLPPAKEILLSEAPPCVLCQIPLDQWFSTRDDCAPWGHLAVFRDIFGYHSRDGRIAMLLAHSGQRPEMLLNPPRRTGQPHSRESSGPDCHQY